MMKRIALNLLLLLGLVPAFGQGWNWSQHMECAGAVLPVDIISDANNNTYVTGTYAGATLTIGSRSVTNAGGLDVFIAKFNNLGVLQWLVSIGGNADDEVASLMLNGNNLYVAGNFQSTLLYFTPTVSIPNDNNWDSFIATYNLNGVYQSHTKIFGGNDVERIKEVLFDAVNNRFVIIAMFKAQIVYTDLNGPVTLPVRSNNKDLFLATANVSGVILDTAVYTTTVQNAVLKNINLSNDNGYYVSGSLYGTVRFDATHSITGTVANTSDMIVVKVNNNLDFQWARKAGGTGNDHVNSSIQDKYGNIYLAGKGEAAITFDSTATLRSAVLPNIGGSDLIIAKYNKQGTLQWAFRKGDTGNDNGYGLVQTENLIQFCGNVAGEVIFNQDTLTTSGISDINTGFAIFNTNGKEIGAQSIGGTGEEQGQAIDFLANGNTVITGYYASNSINIGTNTFTNSTGTYNGFIASYYYPMNAVFSKVTELECHGAATGQLIATPYFGVGPYTYAWSGNVTTSNDSLATNLPAGTYSVTITDSRAVTASTSIDLTQPAAISIAKVVQNVSCHPDNGSSGNGGVNLTVSGGTHTGAYGYSWEAIAGSGVNTSSEDQTTLSTGTYSVTVTDDNGCTDRDTSIIAQPDSFSFAGSLVTDASGGLNNGAINLSVSGGNNPVTNTYAWSSGPTSEDLTTIPGGSYTVTVTDGLGCKGDTTIVVADLSLFIAYISNKTNVDCNGSSTGSATVATSGGTGPYSYAWANSGGSPVGGNSPTLPDVAIGSYFVTVTDQFNARQAQTSVSITQPALALSTTIIGTDLSCYGNQSGIVNLSVSGGTLPYRYTWNNGAITEDLINLAASTYSVTVTDANNCPTTNSVILDQPAAMDLSISVEQTIDCYGDLTGALQALASGGTGTKTYQWDDPATQSGDLASGLEAGTYTVTATDLSGCSLTATRVLSQRPELRLSAVPLSPSCFNDTDGQINLIPTGGTPSYDYQWSNSAISQDLQNIPAGDYSVTVTDGNLCEALLEVSVTQPSQVEITTVLVDSSCFGGAIGQLGIGAQGGTAPYQYSSNNGSSYQTDSLISSLTSGNYTLRIKDANNCESTSLDTHIAEKVVVQWLSLLVDESCLGAATGQLGMGVQGGTAPYQYSSDNGSNYQSDSLFTGLAPGNYTVRVRDSQQCTSTSRDTTIHETVAVQLVNPVVNPVSCLGATNGSITLEASGGTESYEYSITNGVSYQSDPVFTALAAGTYHLLARDAALCLSLVTDTIITQPATFSITITDTTLTPVTSGANGAIALQAGGGTAPYAYALAPDNLTSTIGEFLNLDAGVYEVWVEDAIGCQSDTLQLTLVSISGQKLIIYNAFSPNDDDVNDTWTIENIEMYPGHTVSVLNTWGNKVFSSTDYLAEPWDGSYNGNDLPSGTYYYIIDLGEGSDAITGPVSIVR